MSYVKRLAAEMAMALDDTELYSGAHSIDYIEEYEDAASLVLNGPVAHELRRKTLAQGWDEGYGDDLDANTPRTNPYREQR